MAGVPDESLLPAGAWPLGINNVAKEEAVPAGALRAAVNVDLDADGKASRRPGFTLVSATADLHSIYAHDQFPLMLAADGNNLYAFDASLERDTITALTTDSPLSCAYAAGRVFYSNGRDCGEIAADGTRRAWAVEAPAGPPTVEAWAGAGGLRAGTYQVAVTHLDNDGRESAASLAVEVDVAEGQGIRLTQFPVAIDPATTWVRIYCTPANGDVLYAAQEVPAGTAMVLIGAHVPGRALDTDHLSTMPAGDIVRTHGARLHVATGALHRWSEAMNYGLGKLHENYTRYDSPITMIEPVGEAEGSGLYLAAGKRTYYLSGPDPKGWQRVIAHAHGAVPGTSQQVDASYLGFEISGLVPVWFTTEGQFVAGLPGGRVVKLHADRYAGPAGADRGALAVRLHNGMRHVIAALQGGTQSGVAASDAVEAEVWKNGVRIA